MASAAPSSYVYPETGTLANVPGIRGAALFREYRHHMEAARYIDLMLNPVKPTFDNKHIQRIHGRIYRDVYTWAGRFRTEAGDLVHRSSGWR